MITRKTIYVIIMSLFVLAACSQSNKKEQEKSTRIGDEKKEGTSINNEVLTDFAAAYAVIESKQNTLHKEMTVAIEESGMGVKKYQEMRSTENNGAMEENYSDKEVEKFERVSEEIDEIRQKVNDEIDNEIQKYGFDRARFRQIFQVIEEDPKLQRKFQQLIQNQ